MSEAKNIKIIKEIFDLCTYYNEYEKFIEKPLESKEKFDKTGYLIENDLIEKWKISIFYDSIKNSLSEKLKNCEKRIENHIKKGYSKQYISPIKFDNIQKIKEAIENKDYKLITSELWEKIGKDNERNKQKAIKYSILNKKISLTYNNEESLDFEIKGFIISKSTLIKNEKINNNNKSDNKDENMQTNLDNINNQKKEAIRKEILILVKLYILEKELKQNIDNSCLITKYFLFPKKWIDKFKEIFYYNDLINYIKEYEGKTNEEIVKQIPDEFNNKIKPQNLKSIQEIELKYDYSLKIISDNKIFKYIKNFNIIDKNIIELLLSENYISNVDYNTIKQCEIFTMNNKYLLKLDKEEKEFKDLLGNFDEYNNFVTEYIVEFKEDIDLKKSEIKEITINLNDNTNNNLYKITDSKNKEIGFCYNIGKETFLNKNEIKIADGNDQLNDIDIDKINNINTNDDYNIKNKDNSGYVSRNNEIINETTNLQTIPLPKIENTEKKLIPIFEQEFEILTSIYFFNKLIKEKLIGNEIIKLTGFLISKNWLDKFNSLFLYQKVYKYFEDNNIEEKVKESDMIKNLFNSLKEEINSNNIANDIQNLSNLDINPLTMQLKEDNNRLYPESFYLIDENIWNKFKKIHFYEKLFINLESKNFFINNGKIILKNGIHELKENNFFNHEIIIATLNEDSSFISEILLVYKVYNEPNNSQDYFFEMFSRDKNVKYNLKTQEKEIELNGEKIGNIYKLIDIPDLHKKEKNEIKNEDNNINNTEVKANTNIDLEEKNGKEILEKENKENVLINVEKDKEKGKEENFNYNNDLIKKSQISIENDNSFFETQLNEDIKKDLKALIKFYKFQLYLKESIEESKKGQIFIGNKNDEKYIYLVNENWIYNIINFYNIENLGEIAKNNEITYIDLVKVLKDLNFYDSILEKYKNQDGDLILLKSKNCAPNFGIKNIQNQKILYPNNFVILTEEIYKDLIQDIDNLGGIQCPFIINSGKIIIKYIRREEKENNKYLLLIGNIKEESNKFCYELLLNYKEENNIHYHFDILKLEKYESFINDTFSKDTKTLFANINLPGNKEFGSIILLHNSDNIINNEKNFKPNNQIIENNNSGQVPINQKKLKYVLFLLNLYFLQERLISKFNDSLIEQTSEQKYYLIKNNIINEYKKLYHYNELEEILKSNKIQHLINTYKQHTLYVPEFQVKELCNKIIKVIDNDYYNLLQPLELRKSLNHLNFTLEKKLYKNKDELFYYTDCQLINEEMAKLIMKQDDIMEDSITLCTLGEKTAFLRFDKLLNIGKLDNNCVFNAEIIIKLKDDKNLVSIFNQIKEFDFNVYKQNLKLSQMNFNEKQLFDYEVHIIQNEKESIILEIGLDDSLTKQLISEYERQPVLRARQKETIFIDNESFKNLILFFIDYKDLERKTRYSLKENNNNNCKYYYLLNYHWLMKYFEKNKLTSIFHYLMKSNIIEKIQGFESMFLNQKINAVSVLLNDWDRNLNNLNINNNNFIDNDLKNNNLFNLKFFYFHPNNEINIKFYLEFFLVTKETYKSITKGLGLNYDNMNYCYIGDNLIFMYLNSDNKYTLQVGHLSKNSYYFSTDFFFDFNSNHIFNKSMDLLIREGFSKFLNLNLIWNLKNDFYSPIFDNHEYIIGNAFVYNKTNHTIDYPNLFINNNLKTLLLFYLENEILRKTLMTKNINKFRKYFLINSKWMEEYKKINEYYNVINEFKKNSYINNEINNFNPNSNFSFSLTEKKLCLLIKSISSSINTYYNKKNFNFINNTPVEPNNELYQFEANNSFIYYNQFEIISEQVYYRIFGHSENDVNLDKQKNNYVNCIFFENIILIELSKYITGIEGYVIEAGYIDNNFLFIPSYVLIYKDKNSFINHLEYLNNQLGLKNFFGFLSFNGNCSIPLNDAQNNEIGKICNLNIKFKDIKPKINNQVQNVNNNNHHHNNNFNNNKKIINNQQPVNFNNINNNNNGNFGQMNQVNIMQNKNKFNFPNQKNNFQNQNQFSFQNQNQFKFQNPNQFNFQNQNQNFNFPNQNQLAFQNPNQNNFQNQNHNKKINITSIETILNHFPTPPLMGLKNVGATCYMNATLQCFSQITKLVDYFKYKPHVETVIYNYQYNNKLCLTESFKDLIENLWPSNTNYIKQEFVHKNSNNSYFAPYKFKEKISKMNELFKGAQANDSKDLVNFIVMTLHEEMNKAEKKQQSNNNFMNNIMNQTDKNFVLNNFMKTFREDNKSIISDLFYAQQINKTQCQNCKQIKYNFQTYFFLIFPLEEVRKFNIEYKKNQFIQTYNYMNNINPMLFQQMLNNFLFNIQNQNYVNIYNCFEYNRKIEYFIGDNAMYCNNCKVQAPASYMTQLYTGPDILILILNRGVGIQFKVKLEFTQTLNLTSYIEEKKTGCLYNLIGVVTHMGESGASGHFIAYCKSPIDGQWYRYNDDLVSKVYDFKREIMDYAMPYILFFQKVKK